MKQSTRLLAAGAFLMLAGQAFGEEVELQIVGNNADGEPVSTVSVNLDSKIRFTSEGVDVYNGETLTGVFGYVDINNLTFRYHKITGVESTIADSALRLRRNPVEETLELEGFTGDPVALVVTDLKGAVRAEIAEWNGEAVPVGSLAPGLYFVTVNKTTLKFIKK